MRRLHVQLYAAVVGSLALFALLMPLAWHWMPPEQESRRFLDAATALLGDLLPAADAPADAQRAALARIATRIGVDLTLRAPDGTLVAAVGAAQEPPPPDRAESGLRHGGSGLALRLPDGRWLLIRDPHHSHRGWLATVALLAFAVAVVAWPISRRITRRLERLQRQVEALGAGDLGARVSVQGRDEIASLARSFNRAAERIERLVNAQRNALAFASHELRSPLARIRVAIELLGSGERDDVRARVARDIEELDGLIDELLLSSRLDARDAGRAGLRGEHVELLALVAEEAARVGAEASGETVTLRGDRALLRRLARNLLENARRHGGGSPVEAHVERLEGGGARIRVEDRGPGVPIEERERIFEPFYRPAGMREAAGGGVGLGLALVRQIARHHHGEARCLPREGGGSVFEVELRG